MVLLVIKVWMSWKQLQIILWKWRINHYMKTVNKWKSIRELWCKNWVNLKKKQDQNHRLAWNNSKSIRWDLVHNWTQILANDKLIQKRGLELLMVIYSLLHLRKVIKNRQQIRMSMNKYRGKLIIKIFQETQEVKDKDQTFQYQQAILHLTLIKISQGKIKENGLLDMVVMPILTSWVLISNKQTIFNLQKANNLLSKSEVQQIC